MRESHLDKHNAWSGGTRSVNSTDASRRLTPLASRQAFAHYRSASPGGAPTALAIHVLDVVDGEISAFHAFIDATLFEVFGLPLEPEF